MIKYITGDELITRFGIQKWQIFECIEEGLQPYWLDRGKAKKIVDGTLIAKKYIVLRKEFQAVKKENNHLQNQDIKKIAFKKCRELFPELPWKPEDYHPMNLRLPNDMLGKNVDKAHAMVIKAMEFFLFKESDIRKFEEKKLSDRETNLFISKETELKWQGITATVLNNTEILFQFKDKGTTKNYQQMGFENKKNGLPTKAWKTLLDASQVGGEISYDNSYRSKVEKSVQALRKTFRALFPGVPDDPLPIDKKNNIYKFKFHLKNNSK
jgi:hypothetical protein